MAFSKIRTGGFAANSCLTSAEMTSLDDDHANAADKSAADDIEGPWTFVAGSSHNFEATSTLTLSGDVILEGILGTQSGASIGVSSGGAFQADAGSTVALEGTNSIAGATALTATMTVGNSGKITTSGTGRLECGNDDYPLLQAGHVGRAPVRLYNFGAGSSTGTGWSTTAEAGITGPSSPTGNPGIVQLLDLWDGATLSTLVVRFTPSSAARGGSLVGMTRIAMDVLTRTPTVGAALPGWTVQASATDATLYAAYVAGNILALTISPAIAINRATTQYAIRIYDETGGPAVGSTVFHCAVATYAITDLRPQ